MSDQFPAFARAVETRLNELSKSELYTVAVERDELFDLYLASFPDGTNPIFRVRTIHDGSYDRAFIRNLGHVVAIKNGKIKTLWDIEGLPAPYDVVAEKLASLVRSRAIVSIFRTRELMFGHKPNVELIDGNTHQFTHFIATVGSAHRSSTPEADSGKASTNLGVFRRGLEELTIDALNIVLDLINSNALYRGQEHASAVASFYKLKTDYDASPNKDVFLWGNIKAPAALFKNTVIGTLVEDLSTGVDLEKAVRSFEKKVAPENYKRPTALITPKMIDQAVEKLKDLGLESAVQRRHAKLSDVSVNNVLFVDNSVKSQMKDGLAGLLMEAVKPAKVDIKHAEAISMDDFLKTIVPQASSIDLLVQNKHLGNFVSITAPVDPAAGRLFKWNNGFAWSYDGDVADGLRQRVAALGGRVDGALRFSHTWNYDGKNQSLMDLHVFMPGYSGSVGDTNEIHDRYPTSKRVGWNSRKDVWSGGVQDVDYTQPPGDFVPVENISFPRLDKMPEGTYVFKIHNWQLRQPTTSGFKAEIEFAGQIFQYEYPHAVKHKQWITLAEVTLKNGKFTIKHHLAPTTASQKKWGIDTETLVPVNTLMTSPNHWDGQAAGNKHWFFILKDCVNPEPTRGIYNEFLKSELEEHRKVFEVLGSKTKCAPAADQLSGIGFSSTRKDEATVVVKGAKINKAFHITF